MSERDHVALEATSNTWELPDELCGWVGQVTVANSYKIKLISHVPAKTDRHDALVLAQLQAAHCCPQCGCHRYLCESCGYPGYKLALRLSCGFSAYQSPT